MLCNFTFSWDAAAVIVAVCALVLSILSQRAAVRSQEAAEKHNKLSVRPRLTTSTNREFVTFGPRSGVQVLVSLANVGLGPAVIRSADALLDGNVVDVEVADDLRPLLAQVLPGCTLGPTLSYLKLNKEHAIAVGETFELVRVQVVDPPTTVKKDLERFHLRICYESLYGESFVYDSREHGS